MFLETKPVSLPTIKKYHGLFNRIFGHDYENEDVLPISEEMFEEVFCSDEENIESGILRDNHIADDEMIDNSDNLGDTIFSRVSHRTNSRLTKPHRDMLTRFKNVSVLYSTLCRRMHSQNVE